MNRMSNDRTSCMFGWKDSAFVLQIKNCQVYMKWLTFNQKIKQEEDMAIDSQEPSKVSQSTYSSTSLALDADSDYKLIGSSFTFDPCLFAHIPVIIVGAKAHKPQVENATRQKPFTCLIIGVRAEKEKPDTQDPSSVFKLVLLRKVYLGRKSKSSLDIFLTKHQVRVAAFYNLIVLNLTSLLVTLHSSVGTAAQHVLEKSCDTHQDIADSQDKSLRVLDVFSNHITHETFLLVLYKCSQGTPHCEVLSFVQRNCDTILPPASNTSNLTNTLSDSFSKAIPLSSAFPDDYSEIVVAAKVNSFASRQAPDNDNTPVSYKSAVVLVTVTGYALKFVDGKMTAIVNIKDNISDCDMDIRKADVSFVTLRKGGVEKTVLKVNSSCLLVDWQEEQVARCWENVRQISALGTGANSDKSSSILLFLTPDIIDITEGNHLDSTLHSENLLVVDCFAVSEVTVREDVPALLQPGQDTKSGSDHHQSLPQCAGDVLLAQRKSHESSLIEAKTELASKEQFLMESWNKLQSELQGVEMKKTFHGVPMSFSSGFYNPPLLPLCGTSRTSHSNDILSIAQQSQSSGERKSGFLRLEVGEPWKRTVGSLLVVGLEVINRGDSTINNARLVLAPLDPVRDGMSECVSKSARTSSLPTDHQTGGGGGGAWLKPGVTQTLMCSLDTAQIFSPEDIHVHLMVKYSEMRNLKCSQSTNGTGDSVFSMDCGMLTMTSDDQLKGTYSVEQMFTVAEPGRSDSDTITDIDALDCVQMSTSLTASSAVNSIRCLQQKLANHPDVRCLHTGLSNEDDSFTGHYIVVADNLLRLARVKLLGQINKHEGHLRLFTRSESQAVLLVKFLQSIVSEAITFDPCVPSPTQVLLQASQMLQSELEDEISELRSKLKDIQSSKETASVSTTKENTEAITVEVSRSLSTTTQVGGECGVSGPSAVSPTFHSRRAAVKPTSSPSAASHRNRTLETGEKDAFLKERQKIQKSRKRLKEKLGFE